MDAAFSPVQMEVENAEDARGKETEAKDALENMRLMAADSLEKFNSDVRYYLISMLKTCDLT